MTNVLLGALVAGCAALLAEGYVLMGRQQRQANRLDQFLEAARILLARVPSTSAPRTDAQPDVVPTRWFARLRATAPDPVSELSSDTRPSARVLVEEWATHVDHDQAPTDRIPLTGGRHRHLGGPR